MAYTRFAAADSDGAVLEQSNYMRSQFVNAGAYHSRNEDARSKVWGNPRGMTQNSAFRVLVVDDELLIRWSLAETLKERGYTVAEAESGAGALRVLHTSPSFDAVVLDYRLPDTDKLSLLAEIRRTAPLTPVILMTAFSTPEVVEGALALGAYGLVDKPFDVHEMEAVVRRACEAR